MVHHHHSIAPRRSRYKTTTKCCHSHVLSWCTLWTVWMLVVFLGQWKISHLTRDTTQLHLDWTTASWLPTDPHQPINSSHYVHSNTIRNNSWDLLIKVFESQRHWFNNNTTTNPLGVAEEDLNDLVSLDYCTAWEHVSQNASFWNEFLAWSLPLWPHEATTASVEEPFHVWWQLLELYLQRRRQPGLCDYTHYHPTVPPNKDTRRIARYLRTLSSFAITSRLLVTMVVHQDLPHIQACVQALLSSSSNDNVVVLLHVTQPRTAAQKKFVQELRAYAKQHPSIHVLQFGTIVYGTNSVTTIQWKIWNWVVRDVQFGQYDYYLALDGASLPLQSNLTRMLDSQPNAHAWLGPQLHKGRRVTSSNEQQVRAWLQSKRLFLPTTTTKSTSNGEWTTRRLPRNSMGPSFVISPEILAAFRQKTHSGNTAVYRRHVVEQMVASPLVQELMALQASAAFGCLEEHVWAAALHLIGVSSVHEQQQQQQQRPAVLQLYHVWNSSSTTTTTAKTKNAVLQLPSANQTTCFQLEDAVLVEHLLSLPSSSSSSDKIDLVYDDQVHGHVFCDTPESNSTWKLLQLARDLGYLVARKWDSRLPGSVALRNQVLSPAFQDYFPDP